MSTAITQFRKRIIPHVSGCPFFKIDQVVLDAIIEFCEDTNILRKGFNVTDETPALPGNSYEYHQYVSNFHDDYSSYGEISLDLTDYYTGYDAIRVFFFDINGVSYYYFDESEPQKVFNFTSETDLSIYPFDINNTHSFFIQIAVKPQKTATTVDDFFFSDWERAIRYLSVCRLQELPNEEWSDPKSSILNYSKYRGEMGRAKLRVMNGFVRREQRINGGYF